MRTPFSSGVWILALATACGDGRELLTEPSSYSFRGPIPAERARTYRIDSANQPIDTAIVSEVMRAVCVAWSEVGGQLFVEADLEAEPLLEISFEREQHGPCRPFGIDTAVAHTTWIGDRIQIHLDLDRTWKRDGAREGMEIPLYQSLLHEMGHVFGIGHTPDAKALLSTDPQTERIERSDRDAFWTLYGGPQAGPNDYVIERAKEEAAVLYGLKVEGASEAEFFDVDGDGRDELLVWRMDPIGFGQLVAFFFDEGPRPVRTIGPRYGVVDGAAQVTLSVHGGERLLILDYPDGRRIARRFGDDGVPSAYLGELLPPALKVRRLEGDLDGDGEFESSLR